MRARSASKKTGEAIITREDNGNFVLKVRADLAPLVSAAPEMLEQLKKANTNISLTHSEGDCHRGVDSCSCALATHWRINERTIAKAEGK